MNHVICVGQSRQRRTAPARAGFTIIELLVVISVIALMVAILMPGLAQARTRALETQCLANMFGTSKMLFQYANDFREFIPPPTADYTWYYAAVTSPFPANPPWYRVLSFKGYVEGSAPSSILTPSGNLTYPQSVPTTVEMAQFRCPSWKHAGNVTGLTSYAMRTGRFGASHPFNAVPQLYAFNLRSFNPSRFGLIFDSISESTSTYLNQQYVWLSNFTFKIHMRHNNFDRTHVLYADQSVRAVSQATMISNETLIDSSDSNTQHFYYTPTTMYSSIKP